MTTIVPYTTKTSRGIELTVLSDTQVTTRQKFLSEEEFVKSHVASNFIVTGTGKIITLQNALNFAKMYPVFPSDMLSAYRYLERL